MIYTLENHELKHAVEEMLFHLLPTETLSQGGHRRADHRAVLPQHPDRGERRSGGSCDRLHGWRDAGGGESAPSIAGLATLDYKRTITELVKTTVYDAVVPFLPQAACLGQA